MLLSQKQRMKRARARADRETTGDRLFLAAARRMAREQSRHFRQVVLFRALFTALVMALLGASSLALYAQELVVFSPDTADITGAKDDPMTGGVMLLSLMAVAIFGALLFNRRQR
jgi:hypothetical protein